LAVILALVPLAASADELEFVIEEAEFIFGEPGHLTIDASVDGRLQITIPDEPLKFETRSDFVDFMVQNFNAEVAPDEDGKPYWYTLHQTVYGDPLYFDGAEWNEANDPVALMVGGREGYVGIEGQLVCVNPSLCNVSPSSAAPTTTNYNRVCGEFICGETSAYWEWGLQKVRVETIDRRWGRGRPYICGYWPTYPKPTPKYCIRIDVYPNILAQQTRLFSLDECKVDDEHPITFLPLIEGSNVKRISALFTTGGRYGTAAPSGLTWHHFRAPEYKQREDLATSFNDYSKGDIDCGH
jgi:hypothetical protein